ncbi:MAG: CPBP family intramembrane glutamic endopeptidase [Candidatus Saccharimonas sp.]
MTELQGWLKRANAHVIFRVVILIVFAVASYFLAMYGVAGLVLIANWLGAEWNTGSTVGSLIMRCAVYAVTILLLFGWLRLGPHSLTRESIGLSRELRLSDIGLGAIGFLGYGLLAMVTLFLVSHVPAFDVSEAQNVGVSSYLYGIELWIAFAVLVVIVPIAEELMFRGMLYGRLRQEGIGWWISALIVSVLFGLAHGQWNVGIDVFILSMVACALREFTGSIWAGVLVHVIKNLIAFSLLYIFVGL